MLCVLIGDFFNKRPIGLGVWLWSLQCMTSNELDMFKVKNTNMYSPYTSEIQIFVSFALQWAVFESRPNFRKVHWLTPNDLDMFKVKNTNMNAMYTPLPKAQIFVPFALRWAILQLHSFFGKVHRMTPNHLDMFKLKNTNMHATNTPRGPNFCLFLSLMSHFRFTGHFLRTVHLMTPNHPDMFKVKNTNMHATYTAKAQIYIRFALRWAIFKLWPNLRKSAPNGPIYGKVHQMTPNDLDMFKDKNTNIRATNTPEAQISVRFALRWAIFELRPNFRKSAPNDPKWPWHMFQVKNTNMYTTYTYKGQIFNLLRSTMSSFWVAA